MLVLFMPLNNVRAAAGGVSDNDLHGMHTSVRQKYAEQEVKQKHIWRCLLP